MNDDELRKFFSDITQRLDGVDGVFDDFHTLLNNHMTEYTKSFNALSNKVETYKTLVLIAISLVCVALGGFVALAIYAIRALIGIGG